MLISRKKNCG